MRLEINAFFMHTDGTDSFIRSFGDLTDQADFVTSSFESIRNDLCDISGGVGCLQSALDELEARIKEEETVHENLEELKSQVEDYIDEVLDTDSNVAKIIHKEKDKFYSVNPWAAPSEDDEESALERFWDACVDFVEEVIDIGEDVFNEFVETLQNLGEEFFEFARNGIETLREIGHSVIETLETAWEVITDFVTEHARAIAEILIGVEVILVGAIIAIATEGVVALPLIFSIGYAAIGAITSGISAYNDGMSFDEAFDEVAKGIMSGAISGFVSGFVPDEIPVLGDVVSAGCTAVSETIHALLDDGQISNQEWVDIGTATASSLIAGLIIPDIPFVDEFFGNLLSDEIDSMIDDMIEDPEIIISFIPSFDFDFDYSYEEHVNIDSIFDVDIDFEIDSDIDVEIDSNGFDFDFDFDFDFAFSFDF